MTNFVKILMLQHLGDWIQVIRRFLESEDFLLLFVFSILMGIALWRRRVSLINKDFVSSGRSKKRKESPLDGTIISHKYNYPKVGKDFRNESSVYIRRPEKGFQVTHEYMAKAYKKNILRRPPALKNRHKNRGYRGKNDNV